MAHSCSVLPNSFGPRLRITFYSQALASSYLKKELPGTQWLIIMLLMASLVLG